MTRQPELADPSRQGSRIEVQGQESLELSAGWQAAYTAPGACATAADTQDLGWMSATVPGTAAGALAASGAWRPGEEHDFDAEDWWFHTTFAAGAAGEGERVLLALDGLATIAEVYLNGELVLESSSMFTSHLLDVGTLLREGNELAICCRALSPRLAERRRPRARWRSQLASSGNLRFFRTMLLGRTPGIAPETATVGPWRAVRLERRRGVSIDEVMLRPRLDGSDGVLAMSLRLSPLGEGDAPTQVEVTLEGPTGEHHGQLEVRAAMGALTADGEIRVADAAAWWPHTHGEPSLYRVRMVFSGGRAAFTADAGTIGFRAISAGAGGDVRREGIDLHINGVRVFARGAIWNPADLVGMAPSEHEIRARLTAVRAAGMNMVRIPGTSAYETGVFHDLCDHLGILVWQDFMFANLDYPVADEQFRHGVVHEASAVLSRIAGRPSTTVLCGNSEVEQQAAMLGLDPSAGRGELFEEILPALVSESGADAIYVPSSPCGGDLPFRPDRGIANYYGVGGYRRPLSDARRSAVRFAAECLAFSNVPDESFLESPAAGDRPLTVGSPAWKAGIPRDVGAGWDFEDVRDHYLEALFGVDSRELRGIDPSRYLEMSRIVTGEVMAEVFGEWRREASPCGGALVLWLQDLAPGAGWGLLDSSGEPKAVYHHLKRALAPVAVWTVDEGLGGVVAHVANDTQSGVHAHLRVALYRDFELKVHEASERIDVPPHGTRERNIEEMLGHFVDAAWAYRFGPAGHNLIVTSLEGDTDDGTVLLSQSVRFPAGRALSLHSSAELGLQARAQVREDGLVELSVKSRLLAYGVRVDVPGFMTDEDAFSVEPGGERMVMLKAHRAGTEFAGGRLSALNLVGRMPIEST